MTNQSPINNAANHWERVPLGDVCQIIAKQVDPKLPEFACLPHVNGENIESGTRRLHGVRSAAEDGMTSNKYLFEPGDVLYSKLRPYLRKVVLVDFRGLCSADAYPIRVNPERLDADYLSWALLSDDFTEYADAESRRARMPKLNREQLFAWNIPLPPLTEQRRIAGRLREQLAEVAKARTAVQAQLAAAQALPAAALRAIFQSPDAWPTLMLGDAARIGGGVTLGRDMRGRATRLVPYLRVANVKDGWLDLSDVKEVEANEAEIEDCQLQFGDLLLTEGGDRDKLGRGMYWQEQLPECIHQNHIFRVRFDLTKFDPAFVSYQVSSEYGKAFFLAHAKQTTGIATINRGVLTRFPLRAPPLSIQRAVAARLTSELAEATQLRKSLTEKLEAIDRLPAALLAEAFGPNQNATEQSHEARHG